MDYYLSHPKAATRSDGRRLDNGARLSAVGPVSRLRGRNCSNGVEDAYGSRDEVVACPNLTDVRRRRGLRDRPPARAETVPGGAEQPDE